MYIIEQWININMRCIEIEQYLLQKMEHKGLTLT